MKPGSEILAASDLAVGYTLNRKKEVILDSISITANGGEMIAVIGANGSGKSTLLRTIIGLQAPLDGNILLSKRELSSYSHAKLASYFSFVAASASISTNITVNELVALGRFPYTNWIGSLKNKDRDVIRRSIGSVGLSAFGERKLSEMSDGERQRAMIARALAQDTRFVVLDEPTAYLDLPNKYEIIYLLREIVEKEGRTVIYTTHDLHIAIGESDKIWLLGRQILYQGSPEDLMKEGRFENLFSESKLEFADESGLYIYPSGTIGTMVLKADPKLDKLSRRALIRLKIECGSGKELPVLRATGDYSSARWSVLVDGNEAGSFSNIYDLSFFLKRVLFKVDSFDAR